MRKNISIQKETIWNTNKPGGWNQYKLLTEHNDNLDNIKNYVSSEKMMNSINREMNRIKYKSFGKVKFKAQHANNRNLDKLQKENRSIMNNPKKIEEINLEIAEEIEKVRKDNLEKELDHIKDLKNKKGKIAAVFNIKESIIGNKKSVQEPTTLINPDTNMEVTSVNEIKSVSLKYCKKLLTNRPPKADFEEILQEKYDAHELRMVQKIEDHENSLSNEMFNSAFRRLKLNKENKYKFILKGGLSLHNALFNLCKCVWESEEIPSEWKKQRLCNCIRVKEIKMT